MKKNLLLIILSLLSLPYFSFAQYYDFTDTDWNSTDLTLAGNSFWPDGSGYDSKRLRLTSSAVGQVGSAWLNTKTFNPTKDWAASFTMELSYGSVPPADGIGLHIQKQGLDYNPWEYQGFVDDNVLSICLRTYTHNIIQVLTKEVVHYQASNLSIDQYNPIEISVFYESSTTTLSFHYFQASSGTHLMSTSINIDLSNVLSDENNYYIGFSGRTGGAVANHDIKNFAFSTGDGSSTKPYMISNKGDLNLLKNSSTRWDKSYLQLCNIDASGTSSWNSGYGLFYIGNTTIEFSGVYDGQNFKISNLSKITENSNLKHGFFGKTNNATIKKLSIENAIIDDYYFIGLLIGYSNESKIIDCHSSGTINGHDRIGGLIGLSYESTINGCSSTTNIIGTHDIGGLIGQAHTSNTVTNSYAQGDVSISGYGNERCGGLIGFSYQNNTIKNSYSTGSVSSEDGATGGLIGNTYTSTYENCFWDIETSGQTISYGGIGKSTEDMKTQNTFTDAN